MTVYDFDEWDVLSRSQISEACCRTIQAMLPGCDHVEAIEGKMNVAGVDFSARLSTGVVVYVDHKTRAPGCSKYWQMENGRKVPELSLETWSDVKRGKIGWTLDQSKQTHYTFHSFPVRDSLKAFLIPFQLLRAAFVHRQPQWTKQFKTGKQESKRGGRKWFSECVFVPVTIVLDALRLEMQTQLVIDAEVRRLVEANKTPMRQSFFDFG